MACLRRSALLENVEEKEEEQCSDTDSEENITYSDHDSESVQSASENESEGETYSDYFIGRGALKNPKGKEVQNQFKWFKTPNVATKIKSKNILNLKPGISTTSKDIRDEMSAFSKIIDTGILEIILKCTNQVIKYKRQSGMFTYCQSRSTL